MWLVRIGILVAILTLITCGVSVAWFSINQWRNSSLETQAKIRYQEALIEQIGKPQVIEQRYFSPQNDKSR